MTNIIFVLGGPGSGKGTQCERIVADFGYKHLSAGDLLRDEVASGSEMGKECEKLMKEGKLVPVEVTISLLKAAMDKSGAEKFLIDGFPRAVEQAEAFEKQIGAPLAVIFFDCPEEEMEKRLLKRGETSGRSDDNIQTIKKRFKTFVDQSLPVVDKYDARGLAHKISAVPPPDEVYKHVKATLTKVNSPDKTIVFVLGGPGSGKGTQCEQIVEDFGFKHLSAGDLLRAEVASGSETGKMCADLMKEGKLVPVGVTIGLLKAAMDRSGMDRFLIDGFPRASDQAQAFEKQICAPSAVIFFDCPEEEMERRLLKRGETSDRADDNAETIKKRFKTFIEQSVPVVDEYKARGLAHKISAVPPPKEVYQKVKEVLLNITGPLGDAAIIFMFGGPGAGKGTQCARICKEFGYTHLSTGDIMRAEVAAGTQMGRQVANMIKEGQLVPDEMTLELIKKEIMNSSSKRFILDGFPRTLAQAIAFEKEVKMPSAAILLECPQDELEKRVLKRGETSGRIDDNLETLRKRFAVFREQSLPVIERYKPLLAYQVNSRGTINETYQELKKIVQGIKGPSSEPCEHREYHHSAGTLKKLTDPMGSLDAVFLLGGPGSGKATQSDKIVSKYSYTLLHAGDLLRNEVSKGSTLGRQCAGLMAEGKLVPMETTLVIIKKAMLEKAHDEGAKRFLITGFPRSLHQAEVFEKEVKKPMAVIFLDLPEDVMSRRLSKSSTSKNLLAKEQQEVEFHKRYQTFTENSLPVITCYEKQNLGYRVSADASVDEVFAEVCKVIDNVHHLELSPSHRTPLLCISGPSGAGKSTLIAKLKKEFKKMVGFSVSHTTKEPRKGDVDGEDYYFTDRASMEADIAAGNFLEHAEVHGRLYGTSFQAVQDVLNEGKVCILDIDVQGVREVKSNPSAVQGMFVFVKPPSMEVLEERLRKRGTDSEESMQKRLSVANNEISTATSSDLYDLIITNDDFDKAYEELKDYLHDQLPATFTNPALVAKRNAKAPPPPTAATAAIESAMPRSSGSKDKDMSVRAYMQKNVVPVLKKGMNALNDARPADPLQFLADYLVAHKAEIA
mmetsp:Transcript_8209/g.23570  ORF Transcript_8209/g.23570 Transcript_8209/m.23570 type:complete len:1068 (-) Transcript_8209:65-3268(-)